MLTSGGFDDWVPAWAPDGRRLVFQSNRDGNVEIYAMNSNGTGLTNLSRDAQADDTLGRAPWSPDGTSIVFVRQALAPGASDPQVRGAFGVAAILIQVALAMGVLLVALRRGGLPFGAVALTLALDGVAAGAITGDFRFAIAAAVAGLVGDLLVTGRPRASDPDRRLRRLAFGAVVPAVLVATYLTTIHLTDGVAWSVPLAFGAVLLAALLGLGLAFLVAPLGLAASDRLEGV